MGQRQQQQRDVEYRALELRASTINEEKRTVEAVVASSAPVPMYDWKQDRAIPEILVPDGAQIPRSRQIPLLGSHDRAMLLGSIRDVRVNGEEITGRVHFSSVPAANDAWTQVREGHQTDLSAGYQVVDRTFVPDGQKKRFGDRYYTGPCNVVTKWRLKEGSLVAIGADEAAKIREDDSRKDGKMKVNQVIRAALVKRGMPAELDDEGAERWLADNPDAFDKTEEKKEEKREERKEEKPVFNVVPVDELEAIIERREKAREEARKQHWTEVRTLCELVEVEPLDSYRAMTMEEVRASIKDRRAKEAAVTPTFGRISGGAEQRTKHRAEIGAKLNTLCVQQALGGKQYEYMPDRQKTVFDTIVPAAQRNFGASSIYRLAEECLLADGIDTRGMNRQQVAKCALGFFRDAGLDGARFEGYHLTGSFPNLTLDAVNKTLLAGYQEFPRTWDVVFRTAADVADFKTINRIRLGDVPNIEVWDAIKTPNEVSMADEKVPYAVECYSNALSFGYKLLVNDDLDALSRAPAMLGTAMSRTVNTVVWTQITGNPTMPYDSQALFSAATGNRKKANLVASGAAPTVAQLQVGANLMYQQVGVNTPENAASSAILNLQPRYIVGPSALSTTIKQLVLSAYDPAASAFQRYNTASELIPVIEPLLDANSATAWYLFADTSQIDTVEVSFLEGQRTPQTRMETDFATLAMKYIILQTFAAQAIDHRGMVKDPGA